MSTAKKEKIDGTGGRSEIRKVLVLHQDNAPSRQFDITDMIAVSLGSHAANDIILAGDDVEEFHAGIYRAQGGGRLIQDLGSRHLFRVNNTEYAYRSLSNADVITIGKATVIYEELTIETRSPRKKIPLDDTSLVEIRELAGAVPADDGLTSVMESPESIRLLYEVTHIANTASDLEVSMQAATEKLHQAFSPDRTFVASFRGEDLPLELIACAPMDPAESLTVSRTMIRRLLAERKPMVSRDIGNDDQFKEKNDPSVSIMAYPFRSIVWLPLLDDDRVAGLFCLEWCQNKKLQAQEGLLRALSSELSALFARYTQTESLQERVSHLETVAAEEGGGHCPIGISRAFRNLVTKARYIASHDRTVLLTGPTGTGKEVIAQFIHQHSSRRHKPFVEVNCSEFTESTSVQDLFGVIANYPGYHNKEALVGKFELADGGTLFLDEIGDLPPGVQPQFLKVLEQKLVCQKGAKKPTAIDVRIITATKADLEKDVTKRQFRDDLYHRINEFRIEIPPLADRMEDIPLIAGFTLCSLRQETQIDVTRISHKAMAKLQRYSWPGNVRELRHAIGRAFYNADSTGSKIILPQHLELKEVQDGASFSTLQVLEKEHIQKALRKTGGKMEPAARLLGIAKQTLYKKCSEYGIERSDRL